MANIPPALEQLLAQSVQRSQYQNPLFQAASNQAFMGLPDYAKNGLSMGGSLPPMDMSMFSGGSGSGANTATALGALSPAILAALLKAFKGPAAASAAGSAADAANAFIGPKNSGIGAGAGGGVGGGYNETGGMGDFGVTTFDSNATTYKDPTQWDYILRGLLGMDPGSGGANASGEAGTGPNPRMWTGGNFGGGPKAR